MDWHKVKDYPAGSDKYVLVSQVVIGRRESLGCFADKNDAIKARLSKEKELFGNEAPQRHLFKEFGI